MNQKPISVQSDKAGIAAAVLCTIHCLIVPALFLINYLWRTNVAAGFLPLWWDKVDYVFLLLSFWAVYHAVKHATLKDIKISLWGFWGLLAVAIVFENYVHWLAYIASAGLVITHLRNIHLINRLNKQKADPVH